MELIMGWIIGISAVIGITMWAGNFSGQDTSRFNPNPSSLPNGGNDDITKYGINEIKSSGKFTPAQRAAEYRRRGKSPSGVIDGVYNDNYQGNGEYNDCYRDWEANA